MTETNISDEIKKHMAALKKDLDDIRDEMADVERTLKDSEKLKDDLKEHSKKRSAIIDNLRNSDI